MVVKASRTFWAGWLSLVVVGAAGAAASAGCSSTSVGTTQAADSAPVCPATIQDTVGQKCSQEGLKCGPTYACGTTQVPIYCTCFDGTFQCVDGSGKPFDGSTTPACPTGTPSTSCPSSEGAANLAACTEAQSGLQCAYSPQCPGGTQTYDVCTCQPWTTKSGSQGFVFVCENSCSGGSGFVPDAGGSSSGSGSGSGSSSGGPEPEPEAGLPSGDAASE